IRFRENFNVCHASRLFDRLSRVSTWCKQWFGLLVQLPFCILDQSRVWFDKRSNLLWKAVAASKVVAAAKGDGAARSSYGSKRVRQQQDGSGRENSEGREGKAVTCSLIVRDVGSKEGRDNDCRDR
ncbi:hypothetical protein BHM03_00043109, partial [Ensete ventricosum]